MCPTKPSRHRIPKKKSRSKLPLAMGAVIIIAVILIAAFYVFAMNNSEPTGGKVLLKTSVGNITIQLRDDRPITTENFKNLIKQGVYDGTIFHRIVQGFVVQGGDPTGTGVGDPSIPTIQDELDGDNQNLRGTVAMAKKSDPNNPEKSQSNSASSQFFINLDDNHELDAEYSVFGTVISGMNVVDEIASVPVDANERPFTDVTLIDAEIIS